LDADLTAERPGKAAIALLAVIAVGSARGRTCANELFGDDHAHAAVGAGLSAARLRVGTRRHRCRAIPRDRGIALSALANAAATGQIRVAAAGAVRQTCLDALVVGALLSGLAIGVLAALARVQTLAVADNPCGGAADFFPDALAMTAGAVTTDCLAVRAAIRSALGVSCWTATVVASWDLATGTGDLGCGRGGLRPAGCFGIGADLDGRISRSNESEDSLDQRAACRSICQLTGETIETRSIHEEFSRARANERSKRRQVPDTSSVDGSVTRCRAPRERLLGRAA
jgi:hypothetical protein